ncbi:DUF1543 domain-containing protein [Legionella brunensis]|uniref:DUF1543 domain-containing protein n=1 Tax=Legionella brunensis TaxID=29422 RepID=A0A0W0SNN4_9GAMM|nr:DUF1543 domain-containing protein [Legionella brunensis]KTC84955.1 hypothetical protein Lbru_1170 [Legionella brunensis]
MNLFVVYIGGSHPNSLIELHDIRFIVANSIEDTYDALRKSWWGIPTSLHIDAWGILKYADGYDIQISEVQSQNNKNKLFFINLGGYDQKQFTELHKNIFVVAADEIEAKQKALMQISDWESPHRDYLYEVDNLLNLNLLLKKEGYYLQLNGQSESKLFEFTCCYNPIGRI